MKRGQVTVFIIIALAVIGMAAVLFIFRDKLPIRKLIMPPEAYNVYSFTEQCIKDIGESGTYLLASKGGYINSFDNVLETEEMQIAYHMKDNDDSIMPDKKFMEDELSKFISDSLKGCVLTFGNISDYKPEFGKAYVKSDILNEKIILRVDYPITLSIKDFKAIISNFNADISVRLGHLIGIKNQILNNLKETGELNLDLLSSYDAEVNIVPYSEEDVIYSLSDNSKLFFNFAIKTKSGSLK